MLGEVGFADEIFATQRASEQRRAAVVALVFEEVRATTEDLRTLGARVGLGVGYALTKGKAGLT